VKQESSSAFSLPTTYWRYGWNKTLPFPAKAMYLINLSNTQTSQTWFMARETIAKNYAISESFISDGTRQLRELNLLDVKYGEIEGKSFNQRDASEYTPGQLYNPEDLAKELKDLEQKYGAAKLNRAVATASLVFEKNNLKTVLALIDLEEKYGQATVEEAAKKIAEKNPDNPKRSAGYLINTIKSMGGGKAS
jgi:DNA-binding IscR family transcriptional regulator